MFTGPCIIAITEESKNQLDATWYFIVFLIGSTCFEHYYANHQELVTMMLGGYVQLGWSDVRVACSSLILQPGHHSSLTAPHLQHTTNQERHDQCDKQHHSRELLMMGIVMLETCWAYKKYNKISKWHLVSFFILRLTVIFFKQWQAIGQYFRATVGIYSENNTNYKLAVWKKGPKTWYM